MTQFARYRNRHNFHASVSPNPGPYPNEQSLRFVVLERHLASVVGAVQRARDCGLVEG